MAFTANVRVSAKHRAAGCAAVLATLLLMPACARPETDVVSTSTEDVGSYNVTAARDGDVLRASVCVADRSRAGLVADRVMRQLYSRGIRTIALDVYAERGGVARLTLTPGGRTSAPLGGKAPTGLCGGSTHKERS
jgi:hypothetical protein